MPESHHLKQAMKSADWFISESGLENLFNAGVSTGWLKSWVRSAGAENIHIHLLESDTWHDSTADWQLFFATEHELNHIVNRDDYFSGFSSTILKLDNPLRNVCCYARGNKRILLLPTGDIAYQRHCYLSFLNDGSALSPLYVCAGDTMPLALETGLSATLIKPIDHGYLNSTGLLIEEQMIAALETHKLCIRTVESCTGGAIAARLCRFPGASAVVDRSWVTYSNAAKEQEVGVDQACIDKYGAVSREVVIAMAEGGVERRFKSELKPESKTKQASNPSYICIAVSGVAGPGGGTQKNPLGTVWIAVALKGHITQSRCLNLSGARHDIQHQTVIAALCLLLDTMDECL